MLRAMSAAGSDRGDDLEAQGRSLDVEPTRLRGSGGGRGRGIVVLGVVAVVIGTAVGLAQLASPHPSPVAVVPVSTPDVAAATPAEPSATTTRSVQPTRLRPADLAQALHDGSIAGRLVFVEGSLDVTPVHCRSLKEGWSGCVDLSVAGLGARLWAGEGVRPWPGDPPAGSLLVTVARTDGLLYLGALTPDRDHVAGITALEAKLADRGHEAAHDGSLYEVEGSLVPLPRRSCPEGCPAASPFLVDKLASVSELISSSGVPVVVDDGTPDVDTDATVVQGTFLVGRTDDEAWQVVARYQPERSIRVIAP